MTKTKKDKQFKFLRRPLAPPQPPPQSDPQPEQEEEKDKQPRNPTSPYYSQSLPSLVTTHEPELARVSPVPSNAPSLASDILEEQIQHAPQNTPWTKGGRSPQSSYPISAHNPSMYMDPGDWKFILESRYRLKWDKEKGIKSFESPSLLKPYKPKGPDPFPLREPLRPPDIRKEFLFAEADHPRYDVLPDFSLDTFQLLNPYYSCSKDNLKKAVLSKQNYKKLTTLFASFIEETKQEQVHTLELKGEDIPEVKPRIPQHQILLEMVNVIRQQMRMMVNDDLKDSLHAVESGLVVARTTGHRTTPTPLDGLQPLPPIEGIQGSSRTREQIDSDIITPSELAVLDCLINGGLALSLKAYFISDLPEVSPLNNTITYLNLSFNDFRTFPQEVLLFKNLQVLKMRNNPLKELPQEMYRLTKLKTFVVSFCMVNMLPIGLFHLPLEYLDLSYNKLSFLPNEMKYLKQLKCLNIEGNQLAALPSGALKLRKLQFLRVYNNFMHPLFWEENSRNVPQRLTDLALLVCKKTNMDEKVELSDALRRAMDSSTTCDCCKGPLYGSGLRIIRPCSKAFGICKLPFLFISCSPKCRDNFMKNVESLTSILYSDDT